MTKKSTISAKDIDTVTNTLGNLVLQGKFAHMKTHIQAILGGILLPYMVDIGEIDGDDEEVKALIEEHSKDKVKEMLNPAPVTIPVEKVIEKIILERPVFRRIRETVKKEKRMERELCCSDRDILIQWWNVNQRLISKEDPVCATLADQCNAATPSNEPICSMQVAGFFSHLCRLGLRTDGDRTFVFSRSIKRGSHTLVPRYTKALEDAILKNWEHERANEQARKAEHAALKARRAQGINTPIIANV